MSRKPLSDRSGQGSEDQDIVRRTKDQQPWTPDNKAQDSVCALISLTLPVS